MDAGGGPGFLGLLDEADRTALVDTGEHRPMSSGELLFTEGDEASEVHVVLSGMVKIWISAPGGRQVILDLLDRGSLLGELSAIDGEPRSASAGALEDGELLAIPMPQFRDLLDRHPRISLALLQLVSTRLRWASRRELEFSANDSLGRLCGAILEFDGRYGSLRDGVREVLLPMGQGDLGSWNGLSREAIVKGLKSLRRLGWIEGDGRMLRLLDEESLRERAAV